MEAKAGRTNETERQEGDSRLRPRDGGGILDGRTGRQENDMDLVKQNNPHVAHHVALSPK